MNTPPDPSKSLREQFDADVAAVEAEYQFARDALETMFPGIHAAMSAAIKEPPVQEMNTPTREGE